MLNKRSPQEIHILKIYSWFAGMVVEFEALMEGALLRTPPAHVKYRNHYINWVWVSIDLRQFSHINLDSSKGCLNGVIIRDSGLKIIKFYRAVRPQCFLDLYDGIGNSYMTVSHNLEISSMQKQCASAKEFYLSRRLLVFKQDKRICLMAYLPKKPALFLSDCNSMYNYPAGYQKLASIFSQLNKFINDFKLQSINNLIKHSTVRFCI